MTTLNDLARLSPPPAAPPTVDWQDTEDALGFTLPTDYKQLAAAYGPGSFCNFLSVRHPLGATDWISLPGPMTTAVQEQLQRDRDQGRPVPHAPAELFPIAVSDNGEYVFWHRPATCAPQEWTITVNEARGPRWFPFDGTLTEFLLSVLSGQTSVPLFPNGLLSQGTAFTPAAARRPAQSPQTVTTTRPGTATDSHAIRAWARANGYDVPDRGRIPAAIFSAWQDAHR
ncbi:histone-like nucleoid-structuring protein Lsr2 [Streptomyces sp. NPDC055955]|uniref:Lsr2 family DNA-binding protein n=1 Tax=Streptomyces sp. NPDC055955 TaxID=3345665 RepID=UPI0035D9623E